MITLGGRGKFEVKWLLENEGQSIIEKVWEKFLYEQHAGKVNSFRLARCKGHLLRWRKMKEREPKSNFAKHNERLIEEQLIEAG